MSRTEQTEIERKYDVDDAAIVPEVAGTGLVASTDRLEPFELRAVYFDTAERLLLGRRVAVRRREGGPDAGWHLKYETSPGERREVHAPLGAESAEQVPDAIRRLVEGVLRGRPLHPILVLTTRRSVTRLLSVDGVQLAEIADDEVTAAAPDAASVRVWREWELELTGEHAPTDGAALLDAVEARLFAAGAVPSASGSKLARGLGGETSLVPVGAAAEPAPVLPRGSAADFLNQALRHLVAELHRVDPLVRDGADGAVHRLRTTLRRLRSVLRVFEGVIDPDEAGWLEQALAETGRAAGPSRDLEVAGQQIDALIDGAPDGYVSQEAVGRLHAALREAGREAGHDLVRALNEPGYFELLDRLDRAVAGTPTGPRAGDAAATFVEGALGREAKRVRRRLRAARDGLRDADISEPDVLDALHRARKGLRRLRYALEWRSAAGAARGASAKAARRLHDLLGAGLDAAAVGVRLRDSAATARWAGEDTFAYGVLATRAVAARDVAFARVGKAAQRL